MVVVDVQQEFFSQLPVVGETFPEFRGNVEKLLEWARRSRSGARPLVVHVRASYRPEHSPWLPVLRRMRGHAEESPFGETPETPRPEDFCAEIAGEEPVVLKHTYNAFLEEEMVGLLKARGVRKVLICGLVTGCCVVSTAQGAIFCGFEPFVVEDCCADRSRSRHLDALRLGQSHSFWLTRLPDILSCRNPSDLQTFLFEAYT